MNDRFGSTARDFAVDIVTREGGTPEDVRESFADPDLDRIASDHRAEFDWNTVPGMDARVRDWYAEQFPDDPLGVMIAPDVTFAQTAETLHGGDARSCHRLFHRKSGSCMYHHRHSLCDTDIQDWPALPMAFWFYSKRIE